MRLTTLGVLMLVSCGKSDQKAATTKETEAAKGSAVVPALENSPAARRALASDNTKGDKKMVASGADASTLEVASTTNGCSALTVIGVVEDSGDALRQMGFKWVKCIDEQIAVEVAFPGVVNVSAAQLYADYKANEINADANYRGKALRVSGTAAKIARDGVDRAYVELATPNEFDGIRAFFSSDTMLATLKQGQQLVVSCVGNGMYVTAPKLADCKL